MSILNRGTQNITFDFKHPLKGDDFNTLLRGGIKPGIYSGGSISHAGGNLVTIPPYVAFVQYDTEKTIHVQATGSWNYTAVPSSDQDYLYMTYSYSTEIENWLDFAVRPTSGVAITNEIILGTINSSGGTVTSVNTNGQTLGLYDENWNGRFSNDVDIENDLTVENDLVVNNDMSVANLLTVNNVSVTTNMTVNGNAGVVGNESIGGNLTVSGVITGGDITVEENTNTNLKGNVIINDDASNKYLRVEGVTDPNLIYTDASNNRIGIGTNTPAKKLDVNGDINVASGSDYFIDGTECTGSLIGGGALRVKIINIGDWNMTVTQFVDISHGLSDHSKVMAVKATIRNDNGVMHDFNCFSFPDNASVNQHILVTSTFVRLQHDGGGWFDDAAYNATSYNRGFIVFWYID